MVDFMNVDPSAFKKFIQLKREADTDGIPGLSPTEIEVFKSNAKKAGLPESLMEAMGFTRSENMTRSGNFNVNEPDNSKYEEAKKYFEENGFTSEQRMLVADSAKNTSNREYESLMFSIYAPTMPTEPPINPNRVDLDSFMEETTSSLRSKFQWFDQVNIYGYELTSGIDKNVDSFTRFADVVENILEKPYEEFKTENQSVIDKCKQPDFDPNSLTNEEKVIYDKLIAVKNAINNELYKISNEIYLINDKTAERATQEYLEDKATYEEYEQGKVDFPQFKFYASNTGFKIGLIEAYKQIQTTGIKDAPTTDNSNSGPRKVFKETIQGRKIPVIEHSGNYYDLNGRKLNPDLFRN